MVLTGCATPESLLVQEDDGLQAAASRLVMALSATDEFGRIGVASAIALSDREILTCRHCLPREWFGRVVLADKQIVNVADRVEVDIVFALGGVSSRRTARIQSSGEFGGAGTDWVILRLTDNGSPLTHAYFFDPRRPVCVGEDVYLAGFPALDGSAAARTISVFHARVVETSAASNTFDVVMVDSANRPSQLVSGSASHFMGLSGGAVFILAESGPIVLGICQSAEWTRLPGALSNTRFHVLRPQPLCH
jgi:hypothetical protein